MAQAQKGLGRGLEALLGGYQDERSGQEVLTLPLDAIRPNPEQPRRTFEPGALAELAASIKGQGLLQPVLVRPVADAGGATHEIVAGERRWRAARLAGLTEIPVLVREVDDEQSLALALIENLQREDLNPVEEAAALNLLLTRFGMSQDALAKKVGKSRPAVANALRLLQLSEPMLADLASQAMTAGHARALLSLADEELRQALWQRIVATGMSVREAEEAAGQAKATGRLPDAAPARPEATGPRPARTRPAKDPCLREIEGPLTRQAGVMVKTTGSADHGRITFHYSSRRELEGLLEHFGLTALLDRGAAGDGA
ncbi:parB-like partition protein [Solidesulfovibrio carbinoliphilus subsp. oakridgensis]|uniref:ParB-like partition protein n=1 Tax=Solidesulfovibrio carbinoliphilus subsp. oakridgensis TaxID=694327 RepID=G7Q6W1_9BACT|nr:ParB/RepB/Spo0J family partition protein [Solidesulfovibrio carbinoliphilus]EHJ48444.1 parB-like partition protein [Solidesulfovibrio carbinoliphilus subsp. oakridgensis]